MSPVLHTVLPENDDFQTLPHTNNYPRHEEFVLEIMLTTAKIKPISLPYTEPNSNSLFNLNFNIIFPST